MARIVEARLYQGMRDVLPAEALPRQDLLDTLQGVFRRFGFAPLDTPAVEYLDILLGKYGEEGEKLIYKLAYKGGQVLALRYDLTVPLSRVVAMHPELPLPFKRYQIQPVWRADRPQPAQGRYREFIQCDVDTVGTASLAADAENVAVVHDGILALGIEDFVVRINNRKILKGLAAFAGFSPEQEPPLFRAIDKLDKIGPDGVREEIAAAGLPAGPASRVLDVMDLDGTADRVLAEARARLASSPAAIEGISELEQVLECVLALGVGQERIAVDLHLTRGLDYYTGPVYEVGLTALPKFGSLGGGGRYDDLMSLYGGASIPATGVSIGLSRVLAALLELGLLEARQSPALVLVMRFPDTPLPEALRFTSELRAAGVAAETYYEADRLKKQFQLAERKGIPVAAILGAEELEKDTVNLKRLSTGEQVSAPRAGAARQVREWCE